ncbi:MAG: DUF2760 domain-containing protein [Candidatus Scalindua sp.]|jgi:hypothetical protein|nr:DUF2760 domain-containing protein [Candidatus Scalindua sp.]MBT5305931.1 DUF2760 domain-containing protein [Candidatus Scalindua sp.]MBT6048873.1 DUF2760 domain-containing protein [Candidatus Scalindua sp.]MBT6226486.1 DUF2760 domain-containing protein [Candidatus Scalindua sp.]MBT6563548.1 DUF2760 domain-containing protein [Candidatus Scalindua sp.]
MNRSLTIRSLIIIFPCNAFLIAFYFLLFSSFAKGTQQWVVPSNLYQYLIHFLRNSETGYIPVLIGTGVGFTILSWYLVSLLGGRLIQNGQRKGTAEITPKVSKKEKKDSLSDNLSAKYLQNASLQTLVVLQRKGRLVDFLQENLSEYDDAQIGAAVRSIHSGCKETLSKYIDLKPIFKDEEGKEVTVDQGFDSRAIQLTGNVKGNPPFKGILRHRGWRAVKVQIPQLTSQEEGNNVLAPAEIEIL